MKVWMNNIKFQVFGCDLKIIFNKKEYLNVYYFIL